MEGYNASLATLDYIVIAGYFAVVVGIVSAYGDGIAVSAFEWLSGIPLLILGCTATAVLMFGELDYSWETVRQCVPEGHLSMVKPWDDPQLPWPGLLLGVWLLGFWYRVTNQYVVQRVLGAKSLKHAQWGAVLGGALKMLPVFIMVLPGGDGGVAAARHHRERQGISGNDNRDPARRAGRSGDGGSDRCNHVERGFNAQFLLHAAGA
jgi:uncharacterized sodium:solute symporter family permease YidK